MYSMRPKGSQQTLEWRRHRAIELLDDGKTPAEVADFLDVSRNTVYRWRRRYRRDGRDGIEAKPIPGRPPRLTDRQLEQLFHCLEQGARTHGFPSERWTQARVAALIQRKFGVDFCAFHVGRILTSHGWSLQKSEYKAQTLDHIAP
jgi:transposase